MSTRPPLIGFETRLLAELRQVVTERAAPGALPAAAPHPAALHPAAPGRPALSPAARRQAGRGWPHRRLAMAGGLSAAVAGGLAVALTVTSQGNGGRPAGPPHFAAATTVAAVLDNAALAAQSEPAVTPRPNQFVYSKFVQVAPHFRHSTEAWISVSGARRSIGASWCKNGFVDGQSKIHGKPGIHCTPREFAAYKPWLPSTTAGMLAFLKQADSFHGDPTKEAGTIVNLAFYTLTQTDLTPAQQAAVFHTLAELPHLHLVKGATDALGRTGVGIGFTNDQGESWTTIFDPRTFRPMGAVYADRSQTQRWGVVVSATVVDRAGQRP